VPVADAGKFFGIYSLSGRATSFVAPMAVASITLMTNSARLGMSVLIAFLLVGLVVLLATPYPAVTKADVTH